MRVLLDECLPRRLGADLTGHVVFTVQQVGWAGVSNGRLLSRIEGAFEVFVTVDKNMPAQQVIANRSFGVIILRAASNRLENLRPLVPRILEAIAIVRGGEILLVSETED